jgi:phage terminase small subunit
MRGQAPRPKVLNDLLGNRSHDTKEEAAQREGPGFTQAELEAPAYLTRDAAELFVEIGEELLKLNLFFTVGVDLLATYCDLVDTHRQFIIEFENKKDSLDLKEKMVAIKKKGDMARTITSMATQMGFTIVAHTRIATGGRTADDPLARAMFGDVEKIN